MKKLLKIKAVLMAVVAALTLSGASMTAFAENPSLPPETGSLTIHKYIMPDSSLANKPNDGTAEGVIIPDSAKPINGIVFKIYKITLPETGTVPSDADYPDPGYFFESYLDPISMRSEGVDYPLNYVTSITTAGGTADAPLGIGTANGLAQGFYLVIEQPDDRVTDPAAPFVVAVPMTDKDGSGWIEDVHVYPKNEDVSVSKTNDKTVIDLGDVVTWTINISVPTDIAAYSKFDIIDPLDEALDFDMTRLLDPANIKLEGLLTEGAALGTIIDPELYTVTLDTAQNQTTPGGNHNVGRKTLKVSFKKTGTFIPPSGIAVDTVPPILANYKFVRMTFVTTVNDKILDRVDYTLYNGAKVEFTNRYEQDKERITEEPDVHTGKIIINKVDAKTLQGVEVNGAKFKIASSEANALNANYIKVKRDADGKITKIVDFGEAGYNDTALVDWEETTAGGTAVKAAVAEFAGLQDYTETSVVSAKTYLSYWLVETQAPKGYNLLGAPVKVTFTADSKVAGVKYTVESLVKNTTDFELPKTGGIGTILFTLGGIVLMGVAVFMVVLVSKKTNNKSE